MQHLLRLWWSHDANSVVPAQARTVPVPKTSWRWSALAASGAFAAYSSGAQLVTDSLVVASMVGGSGHGAGASCAGYTDLMDSHDDVFAY